MPTSNYSQDLLALLPDDLPHPTEAHLQALQEIDESLAGNGDEIHAIAEDLRKRIIEKMGGTFREWTSRYLGARIRPMRRSDPRNPTDISPQLADEHQRRIDILDGYFSPHGRGTEDGCTFENGGLKSSSRLKEKILKKTAPSRKYPTIADLSRVRVVTPNLSLMPLASSDITNLFGFADIYPVEIFDYLSNSQLTKYNTPLRSMHIIYQPEKLRGPTGRMLTEVQLVTKRMRAAMDLNHPFDVTKRLAYPSPEHKAWVHSVMMKAAILDYQDELNKSRK